MDSLPNWLSKNKLYHSPSLDTKQGNSDDHHELNNDRKLVTDPKEANVISSQWSDGTHEMHKVFLDIDVDHVYQQSRTSGHGHLMLNVNVTPTELAIINQLFVQLGITGIGNHKQVVNEGQNFLRINISKYDTDDPF